MRAALAIVLALVVPLNAETTIDPLWYLLSTQILARDDRAVAAPGEGTADSVGLASLQSDIQLLADGFESFRDEAQVKETLSRLEPRIAPELRPFFKDRTTSLHTIYRTLAVTDYTWALRFPEPPCAPIEARRKLLDSRDGLFQNEKGDASPWLVSLLGPRAEGKTAEQALDQASSKSKLTAAEYEKRRAAIRRLTLALASDKAVGAARAKLYCSRAAAYENLASYHSLREEGPVLASRSAVNAAPEQSVFIVAWNSRRAAATLLGTQSGPVLVTDASIVEGTEHPKLFAFSEKNEPIELTASVVRRDASRGLAVLTYSETLTRPTLGLSGKTASKDDLVTAIGHAEASGLWTKSSGLVTKTGATTFQTDAAIAPDFSGGPVLNEYGEVVGILVARPADTEEGRWPVAVVPSEIEIWLGGSTVTSVPLPEVIEEAGTAAILNRTRPNSLIETGFDPRDVAQLPPPPPTPPGVCMRYCDDAPSRTVHRSRTSYTNPRSSYGGSSYSSNGSKELGEALGQLGAELILKGIPALFRGIGKLFKRTDKKEHALVDNRKHAPPERIQELPPPPPDPLVPSSLALKVSQTLLAQGEEVEAVATISFTGKEGSRAGLAVSFTVLPGGILACPAGKTDPTGIARVTCQAILVEKDRNFDALQDETRRRMGMKVSNRVRRKPAKGDTIAALKERQEDAQDRLVIEEEKQPLIGTDTPGIYKPIPATEIEDYVIKGDRVTLGASIQQLNDSITLDVVDRLCPGGGRATIANEGSASPKFRCPSQRHDTDKFGGISFHSENSDGDEVASDEGGKSDDTPKPGTESKPENAPTGTKPIDRSGLTRDQIHDIKTSIEAGPRDWTGISPDEDVISTDPSGQAINHGPWRGHTHRH